MLGDAQFRELVSGRWKGPVAAAVRGALAVLERPYALVVRRRNARFDRGASHVTRVPAPVISVGNLTVGGTGKSPFVAWLAKWFVDRGQKVTIISRGYGSPRGGPNDEALELASRLPGVPHLQNPNRTSAALAALAREPCQMLILDDAFQHRQLARDLDIVLLDALEPFGHGRLLPRGLLREPIESLARAQVIALSRSDAVEESRRRELESMAGRHAPHAIWLELVHRSKRLVSSSGASTELAEWSGKRVAAFCGIGNPAGFRHSLLSGGLTIAAWLELPDHCPYGERELSRVAGWLDSLDVDRAVCTRKDLVKIPHDTLGGKRLWALDIELHISRGQEELEGRLKRLMPPA